MLLLPPPPPLLLLRPSLPRLLLAALPLGFFFPLFIFVAILPFFPLRSVRGFVSGVRIFWGASLHLTASVRRGGDICLSAEPLAEPTFVRFRIERTMLAWVLLSGACFARFLLPERVRLSACSRACV